ncbi:MAG: Cof-type HAD-IIB family hydrolase [Longicatena sp.]
MVKLILLDIDGTLRDERLGIPDSAITAIQECRKRNILVVICTGRSKATIPDDVLTISLDGYITGGGNHIELHHQVLWDAYFPQEMMMKCISVLKDANIGFALESVDEVFMNKKAQEILCAMNEQKGKTLRSTDKQFIQEKIRYVDNMAQYNMEPIHKLYLWGKHEVYQKIQDILGTSMYLVQQEKDTDTTYYEIVQRGCDKGSAVQRVQHECDIKEEETLCFGDGQNDLDMFHYSNIKIAMANGHEALKAKATSICEDIFQDGVYNELKRRKLI